MIISDPLACCPPGRLPSCFRGRLHLGTSLLSLLPHLPSIPFAMFSPSYLLFFLLMFYSSLLDALFCLPSLPSSRLVVQFSSLASTPPSSFWWCRFFSLSTSDDRWLRALLISYLCIPLCLLRYENAAMLGSSRMKYFPFLVPGQWTFFCLLLPIFILILVDIFRVMIY